MKTQNKGRIFPVVVCLALALSGCGVSSSDREKLYNAVLATGDLQLSVKENEYEKKLEVSNAPVPGGTTYYIYKGDNGEKYRFDYAKISSEEHLYRVIIHAEYQSLSNSDNSEGDVAPPEKTITYEYTFDKSKIFNKMKLADTCISGYEQKFTGDESITRSGIDNFYILNGTVMISFDQKYVDERIVKYIEDYNAGEIEDIDIVVGTNQGEYKARKIAYAKDGGHGSFVINAAISSEGIPERVSIGDVTIEF